MNPPDNATNHVPCLQAHTMLQTPNWMYRMGLPDHEHFCQWSCSQELLHCQGAEIGLLLAGSQMRCRKTACRPAKAVAKDAELFQTWLLLWYCQQHHL